MSVEPLPIDQLLNLYLKPIAIEWEKNIERDLLRGISEFQRSQMPRYRCHKEVFAFKIASIRHEEMPKFQRATCRGSFAFGSACGRCERCEFERSHGPGMGAVLEPADMSGPSIPVNAEYLQKHKPQVGGYYVRYADGYESFSPAQAFEDGYSLMTGQTG